MSSLDWTPGNHLFEYHDQDIGRVFDAPVFRSIIGSKAFRRLSEIRFLGGIDYLVPSRSKSFRRHSRYDHTLAVAALAVRYCSRAGVERTHAEILIVAALLHDIGHAPLSHSLEGAFRALFGIDHHQVGRGIILGKSPPGIEINSILDRHGVDPEHVVRIIEGEDVLPGADIFSRAVNVDTVEGIVRSARYLSCDVSLNPVSVVDAMVELNESSHLILDRFWKEKARVYATLIQSETGAIADVICAAYMKKNVGAFRRSDYWASENHLRRNHGQLFVHLNEFGRRGVVPDYAMEYLEETQISERRFVIDAMVSVREPQDLDQRYKQERSERKFSTDRFRRTGRCWSAIYSDGEGLLK